MPPVHRFRPDKWLARPRRRGDRGRALREALAVTTARIHEIAAERNLAIAERDRWARLAKRRISSGALWTGVGVLAMVCLALCAQLLWRTLHRG